MGEVSPGFSLDYEIVVLEALKDVVELDTGRTLVDRLRRICGWPLTTS